jgi:hypothetical protein
MQSLGRESRRGIADVCGLGCVTVFVHFVSFSISAWLRHA